MKTKTLLNKDWKKEAEDTVGNIAFDARFHKKKPTIKELCNKYMFPFIEILLQEQKKSIIKKVEKLKLPETGRGTTYGDGYNHGITDVLDLLNQNK